MSVRESANSNSATAARTVVKVVEHPDGRRRVAILRDGNGWFTFEEQVGYDVEIAGIEASSRQCWASLPSGGGIYATAADAEREAQAAIDWLRSEPTS